MVITSGRFKISLEDGEAGCSGAVDDRKALARSGTVSDRQVISASALVAYGIGLVTRASRASAVQRVTCFIKRYDRLRDGEPLDIGNVVEIASVLPRSIEIELGHGTSAVAVIAAPSGVVTNAAVPSRGHCNFQLLSRLERVWLRAGVWSVSPVGDKQGDRV